MRQGQWQYGRTFLVGDVLSCRLKDLSHQRQKNDNVLRDVACSRLVMHQMQHVKCLPTCQLATHTFIEV